MYESECVEVNKGHPHYVRTGRGFKPSFVIDFIEFSLSFSVFISSLVKGYYLCYKKICIIYCYIDICACAHMDYFKREITSQ